MTKKYQMINKRPNAAKKSDINITSETGDTKWNGLYGYRLSSLITSFEKLCLCFCL